MMSAVIEQTTPPSSPTATPGITETITIESITETITIESTTETITIENITETIENITSNLVEPTAPDLQPTSTVVHDKELSPYILVVVVVAAAVCVIIIFIIPIFPLTNGYCPRMKSVTMVGNQACQEHVELSTKNYTHLDPKTVSREDVVTMVGNLAYQEHDYMKTCTAIPQQNLHGDHSGE